MIAVLPIEAIAVIGVLAASMVLACLKVMGAEVEHEIQLQKLRIDARHLRNVRYAKVLDAKRILEERAEQLAHKPWLENTETESDDADGEAIEEAVEVDEPAPAMAA